MNFETRVAATINHRGSIGWVRDDDEKRLETKLKAVARALKGMNVWVWSSTGGFRPVDASKDKWEPGGDPTEFFARLSAWKDGPSIVVAYDLCSILNKLPTAVVVAREAKDFCAWSLLAESDNLVQVIVCDREKSEIPMGLYDIDLPVPSRAEMKAIIASFAGVTTAPDFNQEVVVNTLMGLSAAQAENALAESVTTTGKADPIALRDAKKAMVSAAGLEWVDPDPRGMAGIGGLENLKRWALEVKAGFDPVKAAEYDLPPPCGMLMAGVPGTGKSATAKALAGEWGFVLLRYNGGAMSKYQGESEGNFRKMLQTAEAVAPAILFIDEAEKVLAAGSGETDGGTSERIAGEFLTWLQEKKAPVFVVLTANDPEKMRAELLRAGRLEAKFWLDVPNLSERLAIVDVFRRKYRKVESIDREKVARASEGWTGAEIESAIRETLRGCMISGAEVTTEVVISKLKGTPKVVESFRRVKELRDWARRACMPASVADTVPAMEAGTGFRKIGV